MTDPNEALRRSEERYRLLFEQNPQPMWVYHLATFKFLDVNEAAVRLYGYSRGEFQAMTLRDIRPPEEVPKLEQYIRTKPPGGCAGLWTHRTKFGREIFVEINDTEIEFEGKAAGLVSVKEVTDRVLAEKKLRLQAAALEAAANAIIITNHAGTIEWVNPAFERLTGYPAAEAIGQNPRMLKSDMQAGNYYAELWSTILLGKVWEGELINRRKDGSVYTERQTITPVCDQDGVIRHFVAVKQDVTERKRAQEALERSEADYRSIVDEAPYGIYRVRHDGSILTANPALARMLGYDSPEELVGRNSATDLYLSPEERARSVARWMGKESIIPYEASWKRRDGKQITVQIAGRRFRSVDDDSLAYEVFVEDITERRVLEQQFRQAQKMEAVGRLAGGVAHDFNNLLMIISSYAEMIPQQMKDPDKVLKYAGQISEAAARAAGVTQQLLAFSRKQVLQPRSLSVNTLLLGLGKMLPRLLGEDIEMSIVPKATGKVSADPSQIEQVVMNLAVNARDAMPKGGQLVIMTEDVRLDRAYASRHGAEIPAGDYVMFSVSDTGTGMEPEIQAHIFEPFYTTKDQGKGTGLGLATVYGIVKQSSGFIWLYSEPGKGSTFKVYLPRVDIAEAPAPELPVEGLTGGHETILLVEDEGSLRAVTSEYLESLGYKVVEAGSGKGALDLLRDRLGKIELLVTDMVMPGMGGQELATAALSLNPQLHIICVSGYTDRVLDDPKLSARVLYLQKPFNFATLASKIRNLLDDAKSREHQAD